MSIGDILLGMSFDSKMQNLTISRLLDIENYYLLGDDSFYYLNAFSSVNPTFDRDLANRLFMKLLDSVNINGYKQECTPIIDTNGRLWNGTHRIAVCFYHRINIVRMKLLKRISPINNIFSLQSTNLTENDYKKIRGRYESLIEEFVDKGLTYCCVGQTFDEINGILLKAFSSNYMLLRYMDISSKSSEKQIFVQFVLKNPHYIWINGSLHVEELIDLQKNNSNIQFSTNCLQGQKLFQEIKNVK